MFKVAAKRRVTWPVTISYPQDGGSVRKERCDIEFEVINTDEQQQVIQSGGDLLDVQVVGWPDGKGPKDEADQRVPFSPEAKAELIKWPHVRQALFEALGEINSGRAAARKN